MSAVQVWRGPRPVLVEPTSKLLPGRSRRPLRGRHLPLALLVASPIAGRPGLALDRLAGGLRALRGPLPGRDRPAGRPDRPLALRHVRRRNVDDLRGPPPGRASDRDRRLRGPAAPLRRGRDRPRRGRGGRDRPPHARGRGAAPPRDRSLPPRPPAARVGPREHRERERAPARRGVGPARLRRRPQPQPRAAPDLLRADHQHQGQGRVRLRDRLPARGQRDDAGPAGALRPRAPAHAGRQLPQAHPGRPRALDPHGRGLGRPDRQDRPGRRHPDRLALRRDRPGHALGPGRAAARPPERDRRDPARAPPPLRLQRLRRAHPRLAGQPGRDRGRERAPLRRGGQGPGAARARPAQVRAALDGQPRAAHAAGLDQGLRRHPAARRRRPGTTRPGASSCRSSTRRATGSAS